jgi:hypothetical protein
VTRVQAAKLWFFPYNLGNSQGFNAPQSQPVIFFGRTDRRISGTWIQVGSFQAAEKQKIAGTWFVHWSKSPISAAFSDF